MSDTIPIIANPFEKAMAFVCGLWPFAQKETSTPSSSPFFANLPRELRDKIYEYAYCDRNERLIVVTKRQWMQRQQTKLRYGAISQLAPLPQSPMSCMIVSKAYFDEASSALLSSLLIETDGASSLQIFIHQLSKPKKESIRKLSIRMDFDFKHPKNLPTLHSLRNLRELDLVVCGTLFLAGMRPCTQVMSDEDFASIAGIRPILDLPRRVLVRVEPNKNTTKLCEHYSSAKQWNDNVAALEAFIAANRTDKLLSRSSRVHANEIEAKLLPPVIAALIIALLVLLCVALCGLLIALMPEGDVVRRTRSL